MIILGDYTYSNHTAFVPKMSSFNIVFQGPFLKIFILLSWAWFLETICNRQILGCPMTSASWCSCPSVIPSSQRGQGLWLVPSNRIWQREQDIPNYMSMRILPKIVTHLRGDTLSLAGFEEASHHVEKVHITRSWEWPKTDTQPEIEGLSQHPGRNWMLPTTMWAWKQTLPSQAFRWDPNAG